MHVYKSWRGHNLGLSGFKERSLRTPVLWWEIVETRSRAALLGKCTQTREGGSIRKETTKQRRVGRKGFGGMAKNREKRGDNRKVLRGDF